MRQKQLNNESCKKQILRQRNKTMSLYDTKSKDNQKEKKKEVTKEKDKIWDKWRIQMKKKSLLIMMMLIMTVITGMFGAVNAATDSQAYYFKVSDIDTS